MSHYIELVDPVTREVLETDAPHQMRGCNYVIGGTRDMELSVTYNYGQWYRKSIGPRGIEEIYGKCGAESIPILKQAIKTLEESKEDLSEDEIIEYEKQEVTGYWLPTRENAIKPLYQLLAFAQMRPDGVWEGD